MPDSTKKPVPRRRPKRRLGVLHLSSQRAEWLASGGSAFGDAPVEGGGVVDLVDAAKRAAKAAGSKPGACVLVLGDGLVEHQILTLPELSRRDLSGVLQRRAARVVEVEPQDALFHAFPIAGAAASSGGSSEDGEEQTEKSFLLVAGARERLRRLRGALQQAGFRVRRTTTPELVSFDRALDIQAVAEVEPDDASTEESGKDGNDGKDTGKGRTAPIGRLALLIQPDAATIALFGDGRLLNRDRYAGDFQTQPDLAPSLIQDLRSRAGYWRRISRGGEIERLTILGLSDEQAQALGESLRLALPGTEIVVEGDEELEAVGARASFCNAANGTGPFSDDLGVPMPPSTRSIVGATALVFAGVLLPAGYVRVESVRAVDELALERDRLADEMRDFERIQTMRNDAEEGLAGFQAELERELALATAGLNMSDIVGAVLASFRGRARVRSIGGESLARGGVKVVLEGETDPRPSASIRALRAIETDLAGASFVDEVAIHPPKALPSSQGSGETRFVFAVETLREPAPEEPLFDGGDEDEEDDD